MVPTQLTGLVCGVEHELEVHGPDGRLDARALLPGLDLGRRRHDPTDPVARVLPSGQVVTADGAEVEVAIPPVRVVPGFSRVAAASVATGRAALERALPDATLIGYSTHLSVAVPDRRAPAAARAAAERFAPLLMLALDRPTSPGLLVRARHERLELCGDFVDGDALRAALVLAVAVRHGALRTPRGLPERPSVDLTPSRERYGWYVDRRAFGPDLYADGRASVLRVGRTATTLQSYVEDCWAVLRPGLRGLCGQEELGLADALVDGTFRSGLDVVPA